MHYTQTIILYIPDDEKFDLIEESVKRLECINAAESFGSSLYAILYELIGNAVRANLKRIFFKKQQHDLDDMRSYRKNLRAFLKNFKQIFRSPEYRQALEEENLDIRVIFNLNSERLLIFVENRTRLLRQEERRIRKKLKRAMISAQALRQAGIHDTDTEGQDLGFSMIVLFLKRLGNDPANFRIFSQGDRTVARLEFPLDNDYVPIRKRFDVA